jgi:hypothetical protein
MYICTGGIRYGASDGSPLQYAYKLQYLLTQGIEFATPQNSAASSDFILTVHSVRRFKEDSYFPSCRIHVLHNYILMWVDQITYLTAL